MKTKVLLAALLALHCGRAPAEGFCRYPDTNRLVWDDHFVQQVKQFVGDQRETFFYDGRLDHQVLAGLGGPPDAIIDLGGDVRFASACRAHSCDEKAAVLFACPGQVQAVGILHFHTGANRFDPKSPRLTIYAATTTPAMRSAFAAWRARVEQERGAGIATEYRSPASALR